MRITGALTIVAMSVAGFVGFALAQQDPVTERENLMKGNNRNAIVVVKMMKGELPYDAAKVNAAFDQWAETAKKFPSLFPDNAKEGGDNRALPAIWTNREEFNRQIAIFAKDVAEQRATATSGLDGLKTAIPIIGKDCDNCHKQFRAETKR